MHYVWIGTGFLSLGLGALGAVLPVLPTTPFILLAAACFARGSDRWHDWLRSHPRFGFLVRDWEEHRAIRTSAKRTAIIAMTVAGTISVALVPVWEGRAALVLVLVTVSILIATRPTPPEPAPDGDPPHGRTTREQA